MIYFTADQHFGHENILKLCNRPFSTIAEMDNALIANWNNVVSKNDTIYILGDFSWRNGQKYAIKLNGNKIFLMGDHDKQITGERLSILKINNIWFTLCHWPLHSWNKQYYGSIHLHGHIHNNPIEPKPNRINVGVDVWDFAPVSIDTILDILKTS
jgi:calcineurin-like phosphoesterase family protein